MADSIRGLLASLVLVCATGPAAADHTEGPFRWDWQLDDPPAQPPAVDLIGVDAFETPADFVATAHAAGGRVFCYVNVGAWEDWRPDADQFPAAVLGNDYHGWEGERWLDTRRLDLLAPIMGARLDLCAASGFDAVEFDNLGGHDNETGFALTEDDTIRYAIWLAEAARARGLSPGMKNAPELIPALEPFFDWLLFESCVRYDFCDAAQPFLDAGKLVLDAEYVEEGMTRERMCEVAPPLGIHAILKTYDLDTWGEDCAGPLPGSP